MKDKCKKMEEGRRKQTESTRTHSIRKTQLAGPKVAIQNKTKQLQNGNEPHIHPQRSENATRDPLGRETKQEQTHKFKEPKRSFGKKEALIKT